MTVSQDGRGHLKTIQSALDALRPGQFVRVLDCCLYRENLRVKPPPDSGLISESKSIAEVAHPPPRAVRPGIAHNACHLLTRGDGFRLHGVSVKDNGFLFQNNVELPEVTHYAPLAEGQDNAPLCLQKNGSPIRFRKIWLLSRP
jgi:hypothetical protein